MPIERGGISRHSQNQAGKILRGFLVIVGCILVFFLVLWLMTRLNYKLYEIRRNFWPTVFGILGFVIILVLIFMGMIYLANIYGKKKEKEQKDSRK